MLKVFQTTLTHQPPLKSEFSLSYLIRYNFTAKSQRDRMPRIMKHPKFTREGISKKKSANHQYDLTQPHIQYPERYYNEPVEEKAARKLYKDRKRQSRGLELIPAEGSRPLENIINDLTSDELLYEGSSRIFNNITEIEKNYPAQAADPNVKDLIVKGIKAVTSKAFEKNFREVGILAALNKRYGINDKNTWDIIMTNLLRFIRREENKTFEVFGSENNENNFVHILNSVIHCSRDSGLNLSTLLESVESNYKNKIKDFKTPKNFILFTSALANCPTMKNKTEFWSSIEKELQGKIDKFNSIDALTVLYAFSKVKYNTPTNEKLINKFLEKYPELTSHKIEKLAIVAQSLSNLKLKNEKFNILAEKEIEASLDLVNLTDARFILCSFPRLGIKSKAISEQCEKLVIQNKDALSLNHVEQLMVTTQGARQLSKGYYEALGTRLGALVEKSKGINKLTGEVLIKSLKTWESLGLYVNEQLRTKLATLVQTE